MKDRTAPFPVFFPFMKFCEAFSGMNVESRTMLVLLALAAVDVVVLCHLAPFPFLLMP